jgi:hypothetical protein
MNELEDMVCYNSKGEENISDLFWGKYKLESQNASCEDCNIDQLLKYDGIVLPVGLYYLQNFKPPKLNYQVEEEPVHDDLLQILMNLNNGGINTNSTNKHRFTKRKHLKKHKITKKTNKH